MADTLKTIPINLIDPADDNLRSTFTNIEDLAASIEFVGLIEPIRVTKTGDRYTILAGHRRFEAIVSLGWDEVKALVQSGKADDSDRTAVMLIENMQRVDLNPAEQAEGVCRLVQEYGMMMDDVATNLGVSKQWVKDRIGIHTLPDHVKKWVGVTPGGIPISHAGMLADLTQDRLDRLTKDNKVPGQYDIESAMAKQNSETKGEALYRKLKKDGVLVTTEKELKRIITTEIADLSGDDSVIKTLLADTTGIMQNYWQKSPDTLVKLEQLFKFDGKDADKKTLYVMRRVSGFTEWAKAIVVPGEGKAKTTSPLEEGPDELDLIDERNEAKRKEHKLQCKKAELDYIERHKPAELITSILWGVVKSIQIGYRSQTRVADVCERLGLTYADVDDTMSVTLRQENHDINFDALIEYAKKNAANLARAAATVEMVCGATAFDVEYPEPPEDEEYPEDYEEAAGF